MNYQFDLKRILTAKINIEAANYEEALKQLDRWIERSSVDDYLSDERQIFSVDHLEELCYKLLDGRSALNLEDECITFIETWCGWDEDDPVRDIENEVIQIAIKNGDIWVETEQYWKKLTELDPEDQKTLLGEFELMVKHL